MLVNEAEHLCTQAARLVKRRCNALFVSLHSVKKARVVVFRYISDHCWVKQCRN